MTFYPIATSADQKLTRSGWHWHRLQELAKLESGHTPSRKMPEWWGGDVPWLALPGIREADGKVIDDTSEHTNEMGLANSSARLLPKDTVALSRTASVGFVARFGRPMATSQDFANWICGHDLDPGFLVHALRYSRPYLLLSASGAIHKTIYMNVLEDLRIFCPRLPEQHRIAAELDEQLGAIDEARAAAGRRVAAAEALPAAILREAFMPLEEAGKFLSLDNAADLLPARAISLKASHSIIAITSACLRETGFDPAGLKEARMDEADAKVAAVGTGEILIARSNTRELVGRTCRYTGPGGQYCASDLIVRLLAKPGTDGEFLSLFLSYLYCCGYWREHASGASDTMKKITRARLRAVQVPRLPQSEQARIAATLSTRLADAATLLTAARAELAAIQALPAAALRRVFS